MQFPLPTRSAGLPPSLLSLSFLCNTRQHSLPPALSLARSLCVFLPLSSIIPSLSFSSLSLSSYIFYFIFTLLSRSSSISPSSSIPLELPHSLITPLTLRPSSLPLPLPSTFFSSFSPCHRSPAIISSQPLCFLLCPTTLLLFYYTPSFVLVLRACTHLSSCTLPAFLTPSPSSPLHASVSQLVRLLQRTCGTFYLLLCSVQSASHMKGMSGSCGCKDSP